MTMAAGIILVYGIILYLVGLFIKRKHKYSDAKSFILMDEKLPSSLLAPSIFNSWVWITTIIGAAETSILYGISGGAAYAFGAAIGFCILVVVIIRLQAIMPNAIFITEFIRRRFSQNAGNIFQMLSVIIALYILIEMAAGIGFVYHGLFGVSFKIIAFFMVAICVVFVLFTGIRGVIYNDLINFLIISATFGLLVVIITSKFDTKMLYESMDVIRNQSQGRYHNKSVLDFLVAGALRYFLVAIFIALAQLTLDPGYYLKARIAKDQKNMKKAFLLSGVVLFIPVAILSSIVFGCTALALDLDIYYDFNPSVVISSHMLLEHFGPATRILAGFMLLCIAMTTIISSLIGMMGIAALDIYPNNIKADGSESDCLRFGKIFMVLIGLIGALISISLESISILSIDIFCGIVFSASFSAILMGFLSKKKLGDFVIAGAVLGAAAGFLCWIWVPDSDYSWFYGTLSSFVLPVIFLSLCSMLVKDNFNFLSLKIR